MTVYLLDVSVVIALMDRTHIGHEVASNWFAGPASDGWATCPVVENSVVRITTQPTYPNTQASPSIVAAALAQLCRLRGHEFWPDSVSLLKSTVFDLRLLTSARNVTDTYLLGLAASRGSKLATFDHRLTSAAVENGKDHVELLF